MTITAKEILERATTTLQDAANVRWPLSELLYWLNDGLLEIVTHKPNASSEVIEIALSQGTWQELDASYNQLLSVTRNLDNVAADAGGRTGGQTITTTGRDIMDRHMPGWQDPNVLPNSDQVNHVIFNEMVPRSFWVVPGNDGTGVIEAVVSTLPAQIATPADPLLIGSYAGLTVDLPDIYRPVLVNYVIAMAYGKESDLAGSEQKSQKHYGMFAQALGLKFRGEIAANPNKG